VRITGFVALAVLGVAAWVASPPYPASAVLESVVLPPQEKRCLDREGFGTARSKSFGDLSVKHREQFLKAAAACLTDPIPALASLLEMADRDCAHRLLTSLSAAELARNTASLPQLCKKS
jgi:hypothetical protein